jgi:hyperosmotically inducible periplasmic protein
MSRGGDAASLPDDKKIVAKQENLTGAGTSAAYIVESAEGSMHPFSVVALILACAAALAAGRALGDPAEASPAVQSRADFLALDRNRDGLISKIEALFDREVAKRFREFDADRDGHLSAAEYELVRDDNHKRALRDALVTARVKAALLAHKGVASLAIGVETYEGAVHLSGFVPAAEIASKVGRVTRTVDGVRTVDNNIGVR